MKKTILAALLCMALLACMPGMAQSFDTDALKFAATDEITGEWSASGPLFGSMLDSIAAGDAKNAAGDGFVVFQTTLSGNEQTASVRPMIELYFVAKKPVGIAAVTIELTDEAGALTRLDFNAQGVPCKIGSAAAERVLLPLIGIDPEEITGASSVGVVLHGERGLYQTAIERGAQSASAGEKYEIASLECGLPADYEGCLIPTDAAVQAEWQRVLGYAPVVMRTVGSEALLSDGKICTLPVPYAGLSMIGMGERGDAVEEVQALLVQRGFSFGETEKEFGSRTREAVLRAQKYYGLFETGSADKALVACLESGEGAAVAEKAAEKTVSLSLGDVLTVENASWWIAEKVYAGGDAAGAAPLSCTDADARFAVFSGTVTNLSGAELSLGWDVTAQLVVDGKFTYECMLRAESGAGFAGALLPGAVKTLVVAAEAPENVLEAAKTAVIVFTSGESTAEYALIG